MRLLEYVKKPMVSGIVGGALGLFIGLVLLGWWLWPVTWTNATPMALSPEHKMDYMRMTVDSFSRNNNADLAKTRIQHIGAAEAAQLLNTIVNEPGLQDPAAAMKLRDGALAMAQQQPAQPGTDQTPDQGTGAAEGASVFSNPMVIAGGGLLALAVMGGAAFVFIKYFRGTQPASPEDFSPARQATEITKTAEKTDFSKLGLADPLCRTMMTYVLGDEYFDESSSVNSASGEFLGEYGAAVSKTIGVGEPKKATAIEVWLFDKNDIATATKVLMTPHAFGDQGIRGELEAKGELVMIDSKGQVLLETATLQLLATAVDLKYGQGNMPENSFFERITLELAVWPKA